MEQGRGRLQELNARLVRLHKTLLDFERAAYEGAHGQVRSGKLLDLVLHHEQFVWLRSLSGVMARIDEALDEDPATAALDVDGFFREASRLLRSGGNARFETRYHAALQESPEVVMAHADVVKMFQPSR
jgi:hypothetical protein